MKYLLSALIVSFCATNLGCSAERGGDTGSVVSIDAGQDQQSEPALTEIRVAIEGTRPLLNGEPKAFVATAVYSDGAEENVTDAVQWRSSNPAVLTFNDPMTPQLGQVNGEGSTTISAEFKGLTGEYATCTYPDDFSQFLRPIWVDGEGECPCSLQPPMPYVSWDNAHYPNDEIKPFRFSEVHCDPEVTVLAFVAGTTWCGACSTYAQRVAEIAPEFESAGGRLVFVELENNNREPCTSSEADRHLSNVIGDVGIRVGDADTRPGNGGYIATSNVVRSYPTVFIVRTSDMRIIADDSTGARDLNLVDVALNPERDWTVVEPPMIASRCQGQEEVSEPNNVPADASTLAVGEEVLGGVCDAYPDYYRIAHEGSWRLTLEFEQATGDLDVYVWDEDGRRPQRDLAEQVMGAYSQTDNEVLESSGPTLIRIFGYQYASAPYRLVLEAL